LCMLCMLCVFRAQQRCSHLALQGSFASLTVDGDYGLRCYTWAGEQVSAVLVLVAVLVEVAALLLSLLRLCKRYCCCISAAAATTAAAAAAAAIHQAKGPAT